MATRSGLDIPERQVVQKLIANTTGPMKKGFADAYCPSISALYEVAALVKENIHEFKMEESQLLEDDIDDINQITVNRIQGRRGNNHGNKTQQWRQLQPISCLWQAPVQPALHQEPVTEQVLRIQQAQPTLRQ